MTRGIVLSVLLLSACKQAAPPAQNAAAQSASQSETSVTGPVLETVDAAPYTYVRVKGQNGDIWAAAPQFPVKVGDRVVVPLEMAMKNFKSQTLNREFPIVYFATSIPREGEAPAAGAGMPQMMSGHGASAAGAAPSQPIAPMDAPQGGKTIAEVWAKRKTLGGQPVTVRGRVVKFNGGILGHNWIHLQDGTGKSADQSHDLTVTLAEDVTVAVGETITVTGTLTLDKDFGAGYAYPAILENARVAGKS